MAERKPLIIIISSDEDEDSSWDESDDDDDCVILEEDPDKPLKLVNEKGSDDSDDLLVVSEKGQVACRDYPHPRHLCAKFPFAKTPHESHCDKCHCYVCDTPAPCLYWKIAGTLSHCKANDEMGIWKFQREHRKRSEEKVEQPVTVTQNQVPNEQPGRTQNADQRTQTLINLQNRNPHKTTNARSSAPVLTSHHIANELNNLNLGPANTNPTRVLESVTQNQSIPRPARNTSVSQPTNLLNQNDQPNSNSNSSRCYLVPTVTCTDMNSETLSNPRPTLLSSKSKKKGKKGSRGGDEVLRNGQSS